MEMGGCGSASSLLKCWKRAICCPAELAELLLPDEEFLLLWLLVAGWWERGSSRETWVKESVFERRAMGRF